MQYWLGSISQMYSLVSGLGKKIQKGFVHVFCTTVLFPVDFFFKFMCQKWASSWSLQGIQTYVPSHFQKITLQEVKEDTADLRLSCRSYTQSLLVHSIGQNSSWAHTAYCRRELNSTFDRNMCSNHENTTLGTSTTGKVIEIFSCYTLNAPVSTCKGHNSCGLFPAND